MHNRLRFLVAFATLMINYVIFAQDSTATRKALSINLGFMFAPQGSLDLKEPNELFKNSETGFKTSTPVFLVASFVKGNTVIVPLYSFTTNSFGAAVMQTVGPKVSVYGVGTKNALAEGGYAGAGISTPVMGGYASAFAEFGSTWHQWSPGVYMGAFIPLTFKVK